MERDTPRSGIAADGWRESPVPLAAIELELEKLWKSAAQAARKSAADPSEQYDGVSAIAGVARARVLNFVAYTTAGLSLEGESALDVVEHVVATHPFRTILIVADEANGPAEISASVRALSLTGAGGRKIVHEQVRIYAHGPVADILPSVVLPLLLPDLPTFLWWPGDLPVGHAFWPRMVDACDRVIVDSSAFSTPLTSIVMYGEFIRACKPYQAFGDLAWKQLSDWRTLVSQFFDNPVCADCISRITSVTIDYAARSPGVAAPDHPGNAGVALLLAGWLISRLAWDVKASHTEQGVVRYELAGLGEQRIELALKPKLSVGPQARVEGVRIDTDVGERGAHFAVERDGDRPVARVTASLPDAGEVARSVSIASADRATLLARELDQGMKDRSYEEAVAAAAVLARRIGDSGTELTGGIWDAGRGPGPSAL